MRYFKLAFIALFCSSFYTGTKVSIVNFKQLQAYAANKTNDTLYVVNFWATWCDPCVKELPAFQQEYKKYATHKVKFLFVSLNSPKDINKVQNFVDNQKLGPFVLLLDGGNPNDWIDKIDSAWSGTIPATIMYKSKKKVYFCEGELTSGSLDKVIQSKIK